MFSSEFIVSFLEVSMIFLIAAIGELLDQRSGVINLGLEGIMLFSALLSFIAAKSTVNPMMGILAGLTIGAIIGAAHGIFSITLKVDQVVSGMGIWIFAIGLTTFVGNPYCGTLPTEAQIGRTIAGFTPLFFLGLSLPFIMWFILNRTSFGLRVRSVGEAPSTAEVSGINVERTRHICVILGGMLIGLAGSYISLSYNPVWSPNATMGRGWISLALVIFSMRRPILLLGGALLFGFLWHFSLFPSTVIPFLPPVSYHFMRMIPFALTVVVLAIISIEKIRMKIGFSEPGALGKPYIRGE